MVPRLIHGVNPWSQVSSRVCGALCGSTLLLCSSKARIVPIESRWADCPMVALFDRRNREHGMKMTWLHPISPWIHSSFGVFCLIHFWKTNGMKSWVSMSNFSFRSCVWAKDLTQKQWVFGRFWLFIEVVKTCENPWTSRSGSPMGQETSSRDVLLWTAVGITVATWDLRKPFQKPFHPVSSRSSVI